MSTSAIENMDAITWSYSNLPSESHLSNVSFLVRDIIKRIFKWEENVYVFHKHTQPERKKNNI